MSQDLTVVEVVNRTLKPLNYMFDGVPGTVPPGYKSENGSVVPAGRDGQPRTAHVPKVAAEYARRQNVQPGTEDAVTGEAVFLIGVAERDDEGSVSANPNWLFNEIDYVPPTKAIERLRRDTLNEEAASGVPFRTNGFPRGRSGTGVSQPNYQDGLATVKD
jgi:hypothetical protein